MIENIASRFTPFTDIIHQFNKFKLFHNKLDSVYS